MGLVGLLWRALAVFRVGALGYVTILVATRFPGYAHPALGWLVLAGMAVWTGFATWAYALPRRRRWPLLAADLAAAVGALAVSYWVVGPEDMRSGAATLPMAWVAAPVVAWAVYAGRRAGAVAALVVGGVDIAVRGGGGGMFSDAAVSYLNASVLLLLAGLIMGYVARLAVQAEQRLQRAAELEAATRERERLARGIHDSVLQVLALVQRRGAELGGEAARLGRLAGEQEATLRALVAGDGAIAEGAADPRTGDLLDLRAVLNRFAAPDVTISAPADPVSLPAPVATELAAAIGSALDNVRVHCGVDTPVWVLVEAEPEAVTVTVRDDGPGIPDGRLAEAAAAGRLGVAQSIQGRMRDLGGAATVVSAPGQGTEVELRLPLPA
ncbi:MAG: sensor histidine kinase [Micromonosporaceae bacterium]|nr:sensor histidine kinase [Micromonosporaceae bacterium]